MLVVTISRAMNLKLHLQPSLLNRPSRNKPLRTRATAWVDDTKKISTKVDEDGDQSPTWNETLRIPFDRSINDDTSLKIDIFHVDREDGTEELIGSAKLKLKEVGNGKPAQRTLKLTRRSGLSHGDVVVEVLIPQTDTASPDVQRPKTGKKILKKLATRVVETAAGVLVATGISNIMEQIS